MDKKKKVFGAADPGKNGAICIIDGEEIDFKLFPKIGGEYDLKSLSEIFFNYALKYENFHFIIEDVHKLPSPMNSGDWELSASKHILLTLVTVCQIPFTLVKPKEWQKEMWQGIPEQRKPNKTIVNKKGESITKRGAILTKEMSKMAALRLFPNLDLRDPERKTERAKSLHDGVVDALLMAEYCRRKFN